MRPLNLKSICLSLICGLGLVLAACQPLTPTQPATAAPIGLTDQSGRNVTLPQPAQRIVSLAPANTEIVFALGAGSRLIGRDAASNYPPEAASVPVIGDLYAALNPETIVALQPDLVLASGITADADIQKLTAAGLTVYAAGLPEDLDDIFAAISDIGTLTGDTTAAERLVADLRVRRDAVAAKVAQAPRPQVFYEIDATNPAKPWTGGPATFSHVLINLAGGDNIGATGGPAYFEMSLEAILQQDPEIIIFSHGGYSGQTVESVLVRPGWENITAVKNRAVYAIDADLVDRPGPRVIDGLEELARLIHPELFE